MTHCLTLKKIIWEKKQKNLQKRKSESKVDNKSLFKFLREIVSGRSKWAEEEIQPKDPDITCNNGHGTRAETPFVAGAMNILQSKGKPESQMEATSDVWKVESRKGLPAVGRGKHYDDSKLSQMMSRSTDVRSHIQNVIRTIRFSGECRRNLQALANILEVINDINKCFAGIRNGNSSIIPQYNVNTRDYDSLFWTINTVFNLFHRIPHKGPWDDARIYRKCYKSLIMHNLYTTILHRKSPPLNNNMSSKWQDTEENKHDVQENRRSSHNNQNISRKNPVKNEAWCETERNQNKQNYDNSFEPDYGTRRNTKSCMSHGKRNEVFEAEKGKNRQVRYSEEVVAIEPAFWDDGRDSQISLFADENSNVFGHDDDEDTHYEDMRCCAERTRDIFKISSTVTNTAAKAVEQVALMAEVDELLEEIDSCTEIYSAPSKEGKNIVSTLKTRPSSSPNSPYPLERESDRILDEI